MKPIHISAFLTPAFLTPALFASTLLPVTAAPSTSTIATSYKSITVTAKFHASTQVEFGNKVIIIDPVSAASWTRKADLVVITHPHGDHLDLPAIAKVIRPDGFVIAPEAAVPTIRTIKGITVEGWKPGHKALYEDIGRDGRPTHLASMHLMVESVPMYNVLRGPAPGKKFHERASGWIGYVLNIGGRRLYFAGDTEGTPEMKALKNIDAAFLPMNLPFTMTPQEAAAAAKAFKPKQVYPYHYRYPFNKDSGNERTFSALMKGSASKVVLLDWYPAAVVRKMAAASKR